MARNFARTGACARDMAKGQCIDGQLGQMRAAQGDGSRIVIAFDPDPASSGLQAGQRFDLVVPKGVCGFGIVETVTKADHGFWTGRVDIA